MNIEELSKALTGVTTTAAASVVAVQGDAGCISGIAWSEDRVVTVAHALHEPADDEGDPGLTVLDAEGGSHPARLVGLDEATDLALLAVEGAALPAATWRDPADLQVGELAFPLGRGPHGIRQQLGLVASLGGAWRTPHGGTVDRWIEVDATLPTGLRGGPTVDATGAVIGLSTPKLSPAGAVLPHATVARAVERLEARGTVRPGFVGVRFTAGTLPPALAATVGAEQVLLVAAVGRNSPAAQAGWLPGDAVVAVGDEPIRTLADLHAAFAEAGADATVSVTLLRGGQPHEVETTLGPRPRRWGGRARHGKPPGWGGHQWHRRQRRVRWRARR